MKIVLCLQTGSHVSEVTVEEHTPTVFGRGSDCDHKINDPLISGSHFKIHFKPPKIELTDLESKNGTYLNGLRIEKTELYVGDEVRAGNTKITFQTHKMDHKEIQVATFPGDFRERMQHGIQLDFSGTYQLSLNKKSESKKVDTSSRPKSSVMWELEAGEQQKNSKLTKEQIKQRHKTMATMASALDLLFTVIVIVAPLILTNIFFLYDPDFLEGKRLVLTIILELTMLTLYYTINFKMLDFTLGEKLVGIQKLYQDQN